MQVWEAQDTAGRILLSLNLDDVYVSHTFPTFDPMTNLVRSLVTMNICSRDHPVDKVSIAFQIAEG